MNYQPEYYEKNLVSIYVLQQMLFLYGYIIYGKDGESVIRV